jgi:hypothetical protein
LRRCIFKSTEEAKQAMSALKEVARKGLQESFQQWYGS